MTITIKRGATSRDVKALVDTGSEVTLISEQIAVQLGRPAGSENITPLFCPPLSLPRYELEQVEIDGRFYQRLAAVAADFSRYPFEAIIGGDIQQLIGSVCVEYHSSRNSGGVIKLR